jgi:outer membrane protein TolC
MEPEDKLIGCKRVLLQFTLIFVVTAAGFGQMKIDLDTCLRSAVSANPVASNPALLEKVSAARIKNIESQWLPSLELNGRASYQSDVTMIDIDFPGISIPVPAKDQYRISLDLKQTVYDGGRVKSLTELEKISLGISERSIEIEMNKLREQVKDLFYQCLLIQSSLQAAELSLARMQQNEKILVAGMQSGIHLQSDIDLFRIEVLNIETLIHDLRIRQSSLRAVLSEKSGMVISPADTLQLTVYALPDDEVLNRPELLVYDMNIELSETSSRAASVKRKPAVYAFAQAGYGRPGLNILTESFDHWYMAGAGFSWTIWDWGQVKREKNNYSLTSEITRNKKADLEMQIGSVLTAQKAVINSYSDNMENFRQILAYRVSIAESYHARLENGTIRAVDYLAAMDEERLARINLATREILLQKAVADYLFIAGKL